MRRWRQMPIAGALAAMPASLSAQDGLMDPANSGDTAWTMAATCAVLLLVAGVAAHQSGRVGARNGVSVLVQAAMVSAIVTLSWSLVGYTLAFGDVAGGWVGGGNAWMLIHLGNLRHGTAVPESAFALFHIAVATLSPVLMIGAWAERARFGWIVVFSALWTLIVQAPIMHGIWGGGWLSQHFAVQDWSGGLVIFTSAGVSALTVAVLLGRRLGWPNDLAGPRSPALALGGSAAAWAGALGLFGGRAFAANDDASAAMVSANLGIAAALITWAGMERLATGRITATSLSLGILAGIAAIAPAAGYVSPGAAVLFGVLGAAVGYQARRLMRSHVRIDDALDVFAVPGVCGAFGTLLLGLFLSADLGGVGYVASNSWAEQMIAQAGTLAIVICWSGLGTAIVALMVSLFIPMRVSEDAERAGLDVSSDL